MKNHPILFSGPLVRAILAGQKTQTRRLLRVQPELPLLWYPTPYSKRSLAYDGEAHFRRGAVADFAPWKVGDRLWVRETWRPEPAYSLPGGWALRTAPGNVEDDDAKVAVRYHVDGAIRFAGKPTGGWQWPRALTPYQWGGKETRWVPSIHMPRWACRISLEVTEVRVQRVQEITDEDADAEGTTPLCRCNEGCDICARSPVDYFRDTWDSLAPEGLKWTDNPWVWPVTFERVQG